MCMRYRIFKTIFSVVVVVVPERYVTVVIGASSSSSSTSTTTTTTTSKRIRNKWYVMGIIIMIMYFLVKKSPVFNYYHTSEVCEEQIKHKHTQKKDLHSFRFRVQLMAVPISVLWYLGYVLCDMFYMVSYVQAVCVRVFGAFP